MLMIKGFHPPWGHDAFSPLFQISPYFRQILRLSGKFQKFYPEKISRFHPPKFLTTFFSHRPQISDFPPILPVLVHFPSDSRKFLISPPTFHNFPPVFQKFNSFLHTLRLFFPPTLTMMHLCITQCTYWTLLYIDNELITVTLYPFTTTGPPNN